jgi:hypothetical protein
MADAEIEDTDNEMEDHENEMLVPQDDEEVDDDGNVVDMANLRAMLHHFQGDDKLLKEYMCALMACTTKSSPCARHCRHEQNFHPIFFPGGRPLQTYTKGVRPLYVMVEWRIIMPW